MRNRCPTASDHTKKVELDHRDPYLIGCLLESAVVHVAASHVDHDVDSTQLGYCIGEGSLDCGHIGHIQPDSQMATVPVSKTCSHLLGCGLIEVGHRDVGTFLGQP